MKNNILIIGAGQLGSRHLQGVLNVNKSINVFVVDPSKDSLQIAKQRANEIVHTHSVQYFTDLKNIPSTLEIVIIATNSNVREGIINQLLEFSQVRFLILEKVLFPDREAYDRVNKIILRNNIQTWVNHPRRMFESYRKLKGNISDSPKIFQVTGGNWGLGCNGLHFIDLFSYLSSSKIRSIDTEWVDSKIQESKRNGFIEFTGTIKGTFEDNSIFQISSLPGEATATTITVFDNKNRYLIQEGGTSGIYSFLKETNYNCNLQKFEVEYQSTLSTKLVDDLLEKGNCDLPTFKDACNCHIPFIEQLLIKYNQITDSLHTILPIT